ncbi:uncharacterized protein LOC108205205 isoform X2 [Daucus carota subsp. sativus]|nr:PREDICTED: uncharacterized protein LOC108205205 isoform X1 [Daucus carota subsp. sativus]
MATACNRNGDNNSIAAQDHESSSVNKYGGIVPKRKPLISKDHERAFFDSADWALCKQGAGETPKTTGAIETLQPKMQFDYKRKTINGCKLQNNYKLMRRTDTFESLCTKVFFEQNRRLQSAISSSFYISINI